NHVTSAHTSFGSQPQKRSQAICAHMEAKINPPNVNTGNPIATALYVTSSTRSGFTFFNNGWIAAPIRFLSIRRINPYNIPPVMKDQISVLNFLADSRPCIHPGASNQGFIASSVINSPSPGPAIAGKRYSTASVFSPEGYSKFTL